jgi:hypothetical protein
MAPPTRRKSPTPCADGHLITEPEDVWTANLRVAQSGAASWGTSDVALVLLAQRFVAPSRHHPRIESLGAEWRCARGRTMVVCCLLVSVSNLDQFGLAPWPA